ncbi:MAG: hypothetical protein H6747_03375 [Deltaproteobacteria bacterium]|nr:hypothetical protein [Deltaproteobacteria bacterium]
MHIGIHHLAAVLAACTFAASGAFAAPGDAGPIAGAIDAALACSCFEAGELRIDATRSLADAGCSCAYADQVRKDVREVAAKVEPLAPGAPISKEAIALAVERELLPRSPDYERMLRYDAERYRYFLENVRCVCEGCKATVYFSNCQLTCTPAIVYKRRARVFLALGISVDGLIDFYMTEHNATHAEREQVTREYLLPKRQKQRGWLVPALAIGGAALGLGLLLARLARRSRDKVGRSNQAEDASAAAAPTDPASDGAAAATAADDPLSRRDRAKLEAALDDLDLRGDL